MRRNDHEDVVPLAVVTWILAGRHNGSRLYRELMWRRTLAHNTYPWMTMHLEHHR